MGIHYTSSDQLKTPMAGAYLINQEAFYPYVGVTAKPQSLTAAQLSRATRNPVK